MVFGQVPNCYCYCPTQQDENMSVHVPKTRQVTSPYQQIFLQYQLRGFHCVHLKLPAKILVMTQNE
jgi:hypothetical protein